MGSDDAAQTAFPWEEALDKVDSVAHWSRAEVALLFKMLVSLGWTVDRANLILEREGWLG